MNYASALIFPETEPSFSFLAGLLVFFDSLSWYRPAAANHTEPGNHNLLAKHCHPYDPAPLSGEELYRFNRLLREMETSRPDELVRLLAATVAPVATGQVKHLDETSAATVFASLHEDAAAKVSIRVKERLWQARIILKLVEIFEKRETEVQQGLARIAAAEKRIFAALEGDSDPESGELPDLNGSVSARHPEADEMLPAEQLPVKPSWFIDQRVKAWAELFLADSSEKKPAVLAAADHEYGVILLDLYENIHHKPPPKIFSLPLPILPVSADQKAVTRYLEAQKEFRNNSRDLHDFFTRLLQETAGLTPFQHPGPEKSAALEKTISAWHKNLKFYFNDREHLRVRLYFYCFPDLSFDRIFQQLYRLKPICSQPARTQSSAVLAILDSKG